jgi:hypothetical protein
MAGWTSAVALALVLLAVSAVPASAGLAAWIDDDDAPDSEAETKKVRSRGPVTFTPRLSTTAGAP